VELEAFDLILKNKRRREYLSTGSEVAQARHKERIISRRLDILTGSRYPQLRLV
jgi:hypothetical protein